MQRRARGRWRKASARSVCDPILSPRWVALFLLCRSGMRWEPGDRSNIEDARGRSGVGVAGLGIGGFVVLLLLSWATGTNLFSLLDSSGSDQGTVGTTGAVSSSPAEERMVDFVDTVT